MSDIDLNGHVALVTGASLGIGRATAVRFAQAGANVGVNYHSSEAEAKEVVRAAHDLGRQAIALQGDVADLASVEQMVEETVDTFGKLDIAISNWSMITQDKRGEGLKSLGKWA